MQVSVIIAAYNVESFIPRAIESVREQSVQEFEIIVVDDASTDATAEVVAGLACEDPRIRILRREQNGGPAVARNAGLDQARGEWIAILDADDAWRPERLERMLEAAAANNSDFVADNHIYFDAALQREVGIAHDLPMDVAELTAEGLFSSPNAMSFGEMKPIIRRRFILEKGLRYNPALRFGEDFTFYGELLINGIRAVLTAEAYYVYTTPFGFVSNERSAGSRTADRNVDVLAYSADALIAKYGNRLSPELRRAILKYRKDMYTRFAFRRMTTLRRERRPFRLLAFMATNPTEATGYVRASRTYKSLTRLFA